MGLLAFYLCVLYAFSGIWVMSFLFGYVLFTPPRPAWPSRTTNCGGEVARGDKMGEGARATHPSDRRTRHTMEGSIAWNAEWRNKDEGVRVRL